MKGSAMRKTAARSGMPNVPTLTRLPGRRRSNSKSGRKYHSGRGLAAPAGSAGPCSGAPALAAKAKSAASRSSEKPAS